MAEAPLGVKAKWRPSRPPAAAIQSRTYTVRHLTPEGSLPVVERRIELDRRYQRKKKMRKLKARLAAAKDSRERDAVLKKIHRISPWWVEPKPAAK
jgi:hypothetical protein